MKLNLALRLAYVYDYREYLKSVCELMAFSQINMWVMR